MNFIDFVKKYPDEASCIRHFRAVKERKGVVCKKCGNTHHYWNKTYNSHDCSKCGYRTTLRSGTVMESSKLPFQYWLYSIYLMTMTKKGDLRGRGSAAARAQALWADLGDDAQNQVGHGFT